MFILWQRLTSLHWFWVFEHKRVSRVFSSSAIWNMCLCQEINSNKRWSCCLNASIFPCKTKCNSSVLNKKKLELQTKPSHRLTNERCVEIFKKNIFPKKTSSYYGKEQSCIIWESIMTRWFVVNGDTWVAHAICWQHDLSGFLFPKEYREISVKFTMVLHERVKEDCTDRDRGLSRRASGGRQGGLWGQAPLQSGLAQNSCQTTYPALTSSHLPIMCTLNRAHSAYFSFNLDLSCAWTNPSCSKAKLQVAEHLCYHGIWSLFFRTEKP